MENFLGLTSLVKYIHWKILTEMDMRMKQNCFAMLPNSTCVHQQDLRTRVIQFLLGRHRR